MMYMLNEYVYLICSFFLLSFSQYNYKARVRFETGWLYVCLLGVILAVNMLTLILDVFFTVKTTLKRRLHRKKI